MARKSTLILGIILTVIYLVYLVFNHYECIRYYDLHNNKTEYYAKKLSDIPKASTSKVVVAFTATEEQMKNLKPVINSILDQTTRVDEIVLVAPYSKTEALSDELKKVVSVRGHVKEYDDASTLIYTVLSEPEANTRIVLIEPYMVYGKYFIENMINNSDRYPEKIIYAKKNKDKAYGVLVKPRFFNEKICQYENGKGFKNWLQECSGVESYAFDSENTYKGVL
jgi:hypothetical protein